MNQRHATVAIPVRNGGELFKLTLTALAHQTIEHELLVCDSGSSDGSVAIARDHGARVLEIPPASFGHGATRNLLMREAQGSHVAMLTQDAEPADPGWLETMLTGFDHAERIAVVYGPYRPRREASLAVRMELEHWFTSLSPDGGPQVERLHDEERSLPPGAFLGRRGFLTDANACLARDAWERVPFREVPYAEDRVLAIDMLRAGYAKAFLPAAAVLHSHDYTTMEELRRCFDEWRGLLEVYGWREPAGIRHGLRQLRGALGRARRDPAYTGLGLGGRAVTLGVLGRHHMARLTGAQLGSRTDRLPPAARRRLSLERRSSFIPLDLDAAAGRPPVQENRS